MSSRRLFTLLVAALCAALPLKADCCRNYFDGLYLGIAVGPSINRTDVRADTSVDYFSPLIVDGDVNFVFNNLSTSTDNSFQQISGWGEIFAGWGKQWTCHFYLGGRFGVNFSNFAIRHDQNASSTQDFVVSNPPDPTIDSDFTTSINDKIKTQLHLVEFTFDLKPGFVLRPRTMLFGLIGGAVNRETLEVSSEFIQTDFFGPVNLFSTSLLSSTKHRSTVGFRWGLGLEQFLSDCLSLQLCYTNTYYPKLSSSLVGDTVLLNFPIVNGHQSNFLTKPSKQVISLGFSWYF